MASIGLTRKTVALVPYNKRWPKLFEQEKKRLQKILDAVAIEHEGSTSIPSLKSKPVIDVLVGMRSLKDGREIVAAMEQAGYFWRPKWGRLDRHILFARGDEKKRTHYIHVVKYGGVVWKRDLLFRDYLRAHPNRATQYVALKEKLAKQYPSNRPAYTKAKKKFVSQTLKMASRSKK